MNQPGNPPKPNANPWGSSFDPSRPPPPDFTTAMRRAELDAIRNAWGCKPVQHINEEDLEASAPEARDQALALARGVISQAMRGDAPGEVHSA
jgi:hypothetical protein